MEAIIESKTSSTRSNRQSMKKLRDCLRVGRSKNLKAALIMAKDIIRSTKGCRPLWEIEASSK